MTIYSNTYSRQYYTPFLCSWQDVPTKLLLNARTCITVLKITFEKHLPLKNVSFFCDQVCLLHHLIKDNKFNFRDTLCAAASYFCPIKHIFLTGLPIFQLLVPPYVIWRSVRSKIGNMSMSGSSMLTIFYSFSSRSKAHNSLWVPLDLTEKMKWHHNACFHRNRYYFVSSTKAWSPKYKLWKSEKTV